LQSVGGFGGKADRLNHYYFYTGTSDFISQDLARYRLLTVDRVRAALSRMLAARTVVVTVVPGAKP
jgi:zinc protease